MLIPREVESVETTYYACIVTYKDGTKLYITADSGCRLDYAHVLREAKKDGEDSNTI